MRINTNLKNFRKQHLKKNNQIIYYTESLKNKRIIENLIENFLIDSNSFFSTHTVTEFTLFSPSFETTKVIIDK